MSKVLIGNVKGPTGAPGASISVTSVAESAVDGAANVVTFSDGKTLSVRNGTKGSNGKSAYQYAQEAGYSGTESEFAHKLAQNDSDGNGGSGAETRMSDNLFDKTAAQKGKVFYHSTSGFQLVNADYSYYAYVPLRGAGTYRTKWDNSQHSSTGARISILTATSNNYAYDMEFVITQEMINSGATKIAFDCHATILSSVMIVKDRDYPDTYIPYGNLNAGGAGNVLQGKAAVFLGDSICAGSTVSGAYNKYGWGGLIGEANGMTWKNYGKDGGTVTSRSAVSSNLWLTTQADLAIAEYPNADYVIFEGGCNDADQMKDAGLGVISSNYSTFDTSTFSGAFEALVLKLVNAYPNAKIGYIIPQKMYAQNDHSAAGHVHRRFFDRAVEICQKWGIPVIDLWRASPLNPKLPNASLFYVDGQHLTLEGYRKITPMIEAWMCDLYSSGGTGTKGEKGDKGDKGDTGATGAAGKDGVSATHSWNGTTLTITSASGTSSANLKGDKGDKGDTGATGPQGPKGDTGATGPQGPKGDQGDTGTTGPKGDKGDKGDTGSQGPKGDKGDTGPQGDRGDAGVAGKDGKSAYQYAVDGGFTGTEAEFAKKLAEEIPKALTVMVEFDGSSAETGSVIPAGYNVPYYQILAAYERGAAVICCFYDSSTYDEIATPIIAYNNEEKWFYACGTGSKYRYFIQFTPDGALATCDALSSGDDAIKHKRYSFAFAASELTRDGTFFGVTEARGAELDSMIAEISDLNVASIGLTGSLPGAGKIIHVPAFCNPRNAAMGKSGSLGGRATSDDEDVFITGNGFSTHQTTLLAAVQAYGLILTVDVLYI